MRGFKPKTFPRSMYFHVAIFLPLYFIPYFSAQFQQLGLVQIFFLIMGLERFLAEIYKGFFRTEDQQKYFVPSRITLFGRPVTSDFLRYGAGVLIVAIVFAFLLIRRTYQELLGGIWRPGIAPGCWWPWGALIKTRPSRGSSGSNSSALGSSWPP